MRDSPVADTLAVFLGDATHPTWTDYLATNLLDALSQVPDTGDWHAAVRAWCERYSTGKFTPLRSSSSPSSSAVQSPKEGNA